MKVTGALGLLLLLSAVTAASNPPPAEHWFSKRPANTEDRVKITEGTFDDELCFHVKGFASDGEHLAEVTVHDASGREVVRLTKPVLARAATWYVGLCPSMTKDVDPPGEWFFVATLDAVPVISTSIKLAYGKPRTSAPMKPAAQASR